MSKYGSAINLKMIKVATIGEAESFEEKIKRITRSNNRSSGPTKEWPAIVTYGAVPQTKVVSSTGGESGAGTLIAFLGRLLRTWR